MNVLSSKPQAQFSSVAPLASRAPLVRPIVATTESPAVKPAASTIATPPAASASAASASTAAPNMAVLERFARPQLAAEVAASSGKKKKAKLLGGKAGYKFPRNRARDCIADDGEPETKERIKLLSRIERYAEAFPDKNVDPNEAFEMPLPDLRAHVRDLEQRLASGAALDFSIIGLVTGFVATTLERVTPKLAGLHGTWQQVLRENEASVKLIEAKYGTPELGPEAALAIPMAFSAISVYKMNSDKQAHEQPTTEKLSMPGSV